jgi:hypothetical protein
MPLRPQANLTVTSGNIQYLYYTGKSFALIGHITVLFLMIPAQINTQDTAIINILQETANTIGKILRIHPTRSRAPAFRKNKKILLLLPQKKQTFFQYLFHLFPVSATRHRNTLADITQKGQEKILLKICPLRHIPGKKIIP